MSPARRKRQILFLRYTIGFMNICVFVLTWTAFLVYTYKLAVSAANHKRYGVHISNVGAVEDVGRLQRARMVNLKKRWSAIDNFATRLAKMKPQVLTVPHWHSLFRQEETEQKMCPYDVPYEAPVLHFLC
jgi:hypothetical protein